MESTIVHTEQLIESNSSFNYKLTGPFDGSGSEMIELKDLTPERYVPQFGQELDAWKLTSPDGQVFLVPDRVIANPTFTEENGCVVPLYVGEDSTKLVNYILQKDN